MDFQEGHWQRNISDTDTQPYKKDKEMGESINAPVYKVSIKKVYDKVEREQDEAEEENSTVVAVQEIDEPGARTSSGTDF